MSGGHFKKTLARAIGRVPSEEECREAFARFSELAEILDDIRRGRNGMGNAPVPEEKDAVLAENP